jgi:NADPH:quinone reductase-like Zn-dependent oxidoreductase
MTANERTMRAIAVHPGVADSIHTRDVRRPMVDDVPDGRGVLVKVLRVGLDGTDHEISRAEYGRSPEGDDFLIIGHESLGQVVAVGPNVPRSLRPGTLVVAMVRRPGHSIYDRIGRQDVTLDNVYFERGINLLHAISLSSTLTTARGSCRSHQCCRESGCCWSRCRSPKRALDRRGRSSGACPCGVPSERS